MAELARAIANNTSRNAWRDLMVKRPHDESWRLAEELRRAVKGPIKSGDELLDELDKLE